MAAELKSVISVYGRMDGSFTALSKQIKALGSAVSGIGKTMTAVTVPVIYAVKESIDLYTDFDDVLRQIQATGGYNATVMEKISAATRQAGRDTRFMATDAANAFLYLTQAGVGYSNVIGMLPALLDTASAGGMDLATTSDLLISNLYSLGIAFTKTAVTDYTDAMVVAADATNTTAQELMEAVSKTGALGTWLGNTDELLTWMGLMSNINRKGTEAGTDMRNMLINLLAPTDKAGKMMEALAYSEEDVASAMEDINLKSSAEAIEKLGIKVIDPATGKMRSLYSIMTDFNAAMKGMDAGESMDMLYTIFGKRTAPTVAGLMNQLEKYPEVYKEVLDSFGATGEKADIMEGGIGGKTRALASAVEELQIAVGKATEGRVGEYMGLLRQEVLGFAEAVNGMDATQAATFVDTVLGIAGTGFGLTIAGAALKKIGAALPALATPGGKLLLAGVGLGAIAAGIKGIADASVEFGSVETYFAAASEVATGFVDSIGDKIKDGTENAAVITGAVASLFTQINEEGWGTHIGTTGADILRAVITNMKEIATSEETALLLADIGTILGESIEFTGDLATEIAGWILSADGISTITSCGVKIGGALAKGMLMGLYSVASELVGFVLGMLDQALYSVLSWFGIKDVSDVWNKVRSAEFADGKGNTLTGTELTSRYLTEQGGTVGEQAAAYLALKPYLGDAIDEYQKNFSASGIALSDALANGLVKGEQAQVEALAGLMYHGMADGLSEAYESVWGQAEDRVQGFYAEGETPDLAQIFSALGLGTAPETLEEAVGERVWEPLLEGTQSAAEQVQNLFADANAAIDEQIGKTQQLIGSAYAGIEKELPPPPTATTQGVSLPDGMRWFDMVRLEQKYGGAATAEVTVTAASPVEAMETACEDAQETATANPTTIPTDVENAADDVLAVCADAQAVANANGVTIPVSTSSIPSSPKGKANLNSMPTFSRYAEGGRATVPSIFGEAGAEWAIPEEHTQRTADLLASAARASGFSMRELIERTGGLGANAGATAHFVFSPTIYANDVRGVEEALERGKEELEDWFDQRMRDEERMSYA